MELITRFTWLVARKQMLGGNHIGTQQTPIGYGLNPRHGQTIPNCQRKMHTVDGWNLPPEKNTEFENIVLCILLCNSKCVHTISSKASMCMHTCYGWPSPRWLCVIQMYQGTSEWDEKSAPIAKREAPTPHQQVVKKERSWVFERSAFWQWFQWENMYSNKAKMHDNWASCFDMLALFLDLSGQLFLNIVFTWW